MSRAESRTYSLICDRCGRSETSADHPPAMKLTGLFVYANRPAQFQSGLCNHLLLLEMCDRCMAESLLAIGDMAVNAYARHMESMKRYQDYR